MQQSKVQQSKIESRRTRLATCSRAKALFTAGLLILILAPIGCKQHRQTQSSWVGTWRLDVRASHLDESPQEETMEIEAADKGALKYTIHGTAQDGKQYTESYDGRTDGGFYPVTVDGRELGQIAYHWDSDHVCSAHGKGPGGTTLTETATLSPDGKMIMIRSREGKEEEETAVYRKER